MTAGSYVPDGALRLGTRASPLAMAQTRLVSEALVETGQTDPARIAAVPVHTDGDRIQDRPLAAIGGKALWTRELDLALAEKRIDAAVHSMKDVESPIPDAFVLVAVLPRADVADRLIGPSSLAEIAPGATVGTSSPRRAAQLLSRRPDLSVVSIRGNVETRLRKVAEGEVAATFLAAAGLARLGIVAGVRLDPFDWLPASSQGAVGVVCRTDDEETRRLLAPLDHKPTRRAILAERALLDGVGGTCHSAIAALAIDGLTLELTAQLYSPDGQEMVSGHAIAGAHESPQELGARLAAQLLSGAGEAIRASLGFR